jgi:hypothetical protein
MMKIGGNEPAARLVLVQAGKLTNAASSATGRMFLRAVMIASRRQAYKMRGRLSARWYAAKNTAQHQHC